MPAFFLSYACQWTNGDGAASDMALSACPASSANLSRTARSPIATTPTKRPSSTTGSLRISFSANRRPASSAVSAGLSVTGFGVMTSITAVEPECLPAYPRTTRSRSVTTPISLSPSTIGTKPMPWSFISTASSYTLSFSVAVMQGLLMICDTATGMRLTSQEIGRFVPSCFPAQEVRLFPYRAHASMRSFTGECGGIFFRAADHQPGGLKHRAFVEVESRMMMRMHGARLGIACADEHEAARHLLEVIGEVLACRNQLRLADIPVSEQLGCRSHAAGRLQLVIDDRRVALPVIQLPFGAESGAYEPDELGDALAHQVPHALVEGAHRSLQPAVAGNDIARLSGLERADGKNRRVERADIAAYDRLQSLDERRPRDDRVAGMLRHPSMPPFAGNLDGELVHAGHERASADADRTGLDRRP
ncbi:hypothetical protein BN871_DH_00370 [Paenibacillus sp. P22]|nr:hypothetical protein BN871_DH_00370 [Paenibacillus sp. P22]